MNSSATPSTKLAEFAANVHSQFGEDGILAKIFELLAIQQGYFVEFGAWDGIHLSNSYALYEKSWSGCFIEGDAERFKALCGNIDRSRATAIQAFVATHGENTLDQILARAKAPNDLDLLSIDIDSDDLAIWRSIVKYAAKVVVIEYNATIPFDTEFENPPGKTWGNSALAILKLGLSKGYRLVGITETNLIFVRSELADAAGIASCDLSAAPTPPRLFWGYDGSLIVSNDMGSHAPEFLVVPWAGTPMPQPLPKFFRAYWDRATPRYAARRAYAYSLFAILRPISLLKIIWQSR
jgi:hypothetical protein